MKEEAVGAVLQKQKARADTATAVTMGTREEEEGDDEESCCPYELPKVSSLNQPLSCLRSV